MCTDEPPSQSPAVLLGCQSHKDGRFLPFPSSVITFISSGRTTPTAFPIQDKQASGAASTRTKINAKLARFIGSPIVALPVYGSIRVLLRANLSPRSCITKLFYHSRDSVAKDRQFYCIARRCRLSGSRRLLGRCRVVFRDNLFQDAAYFYLIVV